MLDKKLTQTEIENLVLEERKKLETEDEYIPISEEYAYRLVLDHYRNRFVGIHNVTSKGFRTFDIRKKNVVENDDVSETTKMGNWKRRLTNANKKNIVGIDKAKGFRTANIRTAIKITSNKRKYRIVPTKTN